jgi:6-pyruvoyl-tetrahydropterin synthase-like protein
MFALLWCVPLLSRGIPDLSHDGVSHAVRQVVFSNQLWNGEWYPRWLTDANSGLGSPSFFFYPSIPSYAASLFRPLLAARDRDGWLQAGYGCVLAILLSAAATYFWLRSLTHPTAALCGACVYILAPYHLAIDTYVRGAAAELWGFVWLPILLLCVEGIRVYARWAPLTLAVTFALLAMTHLPSVICFAPVIVAAGLLHGGGRESVKTTLRVVGGLAVGAGLAAIYVVPALADQWKVNLSQFVNGIYDYRRYWLFPNSGMHPKFEIFLLFATVSTVVFVGLLYWVCMQGQSEGPDRSAAKFYLGVAIFGLVFMTQLSYPFWKYVPFLNDVSFPWRFETLLVLSAAALSALAFDNLAKQRSGMLLAFLAAITISWMACGVFASWREYSSSRAASPSDYNRPLAKFRSELCEFWPATAVPGQKCIESLPNQVEIIQNVLAGRRSKSVTAQGIEMGMPGSATVLDWQPRKVMIALNVSEPSRVTLAHFYYPDWQGYIDDSGERVKMRPSSNEGFLQAEVPKGQYRLVVELVQSKSEKIGALMSLCFVAILIGRTFADYRSAPTRLADRIPRRTSA